jgi:NADH:ubiquinone oxidoreductase subunit 5 (subunit L)/multisubunit Na+/H+ antiporter MnhA subunit
VGAFALLIIAPFTASSPSKNIKEAAYTTLIVSSMVFFIILAAGIFNSVFLYPGRRRADQEHAHGPAYGKWFVMFVMMFILFILGFFISWQGLLYVVVPIFLPVAANLGFNPLWFGLLICLNLQMSFLTPPFAYAIFFVKGASPPEIKTMRHIPGGDSLCDSAGHRGVFVHRVSGDHTLAAPGHPWRRIADPNRRYRRGSAPGGPARERGKDQTIEVGEQPRCPRNH